MILARKRLIVRLHARRGAQGVASDPHPATGKVSLQPQFPQGMSLPLEPCQHARVVVLLLGVDRRRQLVIVNNGRGMDADHVEAA